MFGMNGVFKPKRKISGSARVLKFTLHQPFLGVSKF